MYNLHTREMVTTRHMSMVERGGSKAFVRDKERPCIHNKKRVEKNIRKKSIFTNLQKNIRIHRASSKATTLFLTK